MPNAWTGCAMLRGVVGVVAVSRQQAAQDAAARKAMRTVMRERCAAEVDRTEAMRSEWRAAARV